MGFYGDLIMGFYGCFFFLNGGLMGSNGIYHLVIQRSYGKSQLLTGKSS